MDTPAYKELLDSAITIRDYFAAKVLNGIISAEAHPESRGVLPLSQDEADGYAIAAYRIADAMMAERAKK